MANKHSPRFLNIVNDARSRIQECQIDDLKQRLDSGTEIKLIDVREESEFTAGHIPGAVWLGKGIIERDIEEKYPDSSVQLYLYCGGGYRSALAADNLQKMGYDNIISVDGGFRSWKEAGHAIEK
jgi:rhodanese-related sulfurtransferase